jgi:hypothetical protein
VRTLHDPCLHRNCPNCWVSQFPRPPCRRNLFIPDVSAEQRKPFLLRVPPDLWKDIEKWAADDLRSVNAQIEFILRQAINRRKNPGKEK